MATEDKAMFHAGKKQRIEQQLQQKEESGVQETSGNGDKKFNITAANVSFQSWQEMEGQKK